MYYFPDKINQFNLIPIRFIKKIAKNVKISVINRAHLIQIILNEKLLYKTIIGIIIIFKSKSNYISPTFLYVSPTNFINTPKCNLQLNFTFYICTIIIRKKMENLKDRSFYNANANGRVMAGIILFIVGIVLFAKQLGVEFPYWLFRWEMLLIVLGFFLGAKHSFSRSGWLIPVFIGVFFLLDDWIIGLELKGFFWPTIILIIAATMIISPFKKKRWEKNYNSLNRDINNDDIMDATSILGGVKKSILSKNFKGGQIFNVFGGVEVDLSQSDIDGIIVIDITQIFGGIKLILPAHWELKSEITSVLGGVEDKRKNLSALNIAEGKTLIIRGTSIFGGIDIKSF